METISRAPFTLKQILQENWDRFLDIYRDEVEWYMARNVWKVINCRDPEGLAPRSPTQTTRSRFATFPDPAKAVFAHYRWYLYHPSLARIKQVCYFVWIFFFAGQMDSGFNAGLVVRDFGVMIGLTVVAGFSAAVKKLNCYSSLTIASPSGRPSSHPRSWLAHRADTASPHHVWLLCRLEFSKPARMASSVCAAACGVPDSLRVESGSHRQNPGHTYAMLPKILNAYSPASAKDCPPLPNWLNAGNFMKIVLPISAGS